MINPRNALNKPPTYLRGAKWNVLGDSISVNTDFASVFYHDIIKQKYGLSLVRNYGISGSKIADDGVSGNHASSRFLDMDDDADLITVFMGTNDCGGSIPLGVPGDRVTTTFYGATHVLLLGLIEKYPDKKVGVISPLQSARENRIDDLLPYVDVLKDVCSHYSVPFLDIYRGLGVTARSGQQMSLYTSDNLHPNNSGQEKLAEKIGMFLESL